MGFKRNTISDEEHERRSLHLISNYGNDQTSKDELFFLYNDRLEPRHQDSSCGTCRAYVWNRLKQMYGR
jgi:hypothetical protein